MAIVTSRAPSRPVIYPETDGKPMAETEQHLDQMIYLIEALREYFRQDPEVYVVGNLLVYYEERNPKARVAPDTFVVRGVSKRKRRIYKVWEEGKGPDLVVEVTSRSTQREDREKKWQVYTALGVREYLLFDSLGEYLRPVLQGYRLVEGTYQPMPIAKTAEGGMCIQSEVVGLVFRVEGGRLWLYDSVTGERLMGLAESQEARRRSEVRVAQEAEARQAAEEEIVRLRAELERLRRGER